MLNLSKYFNQDILSTDQTLKPIVVITEPSDNSILFTLTLDRDEIINNNNDIIQTINALEKVSNIKISNDYDSKKLKINRLRCSLNNYYDVNTKLSEYINSTLINKYLYLFYKSPATNIINLSDATTDRDCALIYRGEISRIKYNEAKLDLTAEDRTQIKIADKQVPYMSVDKLPVSISDKITKKYKEKIKAVPITFGKVDKAPVLPYLENNNDSTMNLLIDTVPTDTHHKTAKIPSLLYNSPATDYYLYVLEDDDYVIMDHAIYTTNLQYESFSKLQLTSISSFSNNSLFPDTSCSSSAFSLCFCVILFFNNK